MGVSKFVFAGEVKFDISGDSVTKDTLLKGATAHDCNGDPIAGECEFDVNSQDATALVAETLVGKTFYARGQKLTGTMPNRGAVSGTISTKGEKYTVPQGYHDGSGKVGISATEQAKLIPDNIRQGVTILGVEGDMSGTEDVKAQSKTVTPTVAAQTFSPDAGYNYFSEFTVEGIPYKETPNAAGGITITIG